MTLAFTAILATGTWLIYTVLQSVYNAFFHPLCCFPGPRLAQVTRWWLFKQEMRGDSHYVIRDLHKIHGKVVRIAPNELSILDQQASAAIYGQGTKFIKAKYFYRAFENHAPNLFTICEKDAHSHDKRLMSNAFSRANILRCEDMIYDKVAILVSRVKDYARSDKPIPLVAVFRSLTLDTITHFCYGEPIGALKSEAFESPIFSAFDLATPSVPFFQHFPVLRQLLRWVSDYELPFVPNGFREMEKGAKTGLRTLEKHGIKEDKGITMFQDMINTARSKNSSLSDAELVSEGVLMNFAGTDTTAGTLAIGLYNLLQNPGLFKKLQESLAQRTRVAGRRLTVLELEDDRLLDACLKESLRLFCPVSGRLPRKVPSGGWDFEGHHIPTGMIVSSSPFYECHDETIFPDPHKYLPERWLIDDTSRMLRYFHPFSRGPRQCIGQNLSLIEQRIAFAEFVLNFQPKEIVTKEVKMRQFITMVIDTDPAVKLHLAN